MEHGSTQIEQESFEHSSAYVEPQQYEDPLNSQDSEVNPLLSPVSPISPPSPQSPASPVSPEAPWLPLTPGPLHYRPEAHYPSGTATDTHSYYRPNDLQPHQNPRLSSAHSIKHAPSAQANATPQSISRNHVDSTIDPIDILKPENICIENFAKQRAALVGIILGHLNPTYSVQFAADVLEMGAQLFDGFPDLKTSQTGKCFSRRCAMLNTMILYLAQNLGTSFLTPEGRHKAPWAAAMQMTVALAIGRLTLDGYNETDLIATQFLAHEVMFMQTGLGPFNDKAPWTEIAPMWEKLSQYDPVCGCFVCDCIQRNVSYEYEGGLSRLYMEGSSGGRVRHPSKPFYIWFDKDFEALRARTLEFYDQLGISPSIDVLFHGWGLRDLESNTNLTSPYEFPCKNEVCVSCSNSNFLFCQPLGQDSGSSGEGARARSRVRITNPKYHSWPTNDGPSVPDPPIGAGINMRSRHKSYKDDPTVQHERTQTSRSRRRSKRSGGDKYAPGKGQYEDRSTMKVPDLPGGHSKGRYPVLLKPHQIVQVKLGKRSISNGQYKAGGQTPKLVGEMISGRSDRVNIMPYRK